jgi:hypothetical protein
MMSEGGLWWDEGLIGMWKAEDERFGTGCV